MYNLYTLVISLCLLGLYNLYTLVINLCLLGLYIYIKTFTKIIILLYYRIMLYFILVQL